VTFRFYAELSDFLSPEQRMRAFAHALLLPASVKDVIESLGVPHPEVDLILANGVPVGFSYVVQHGDYLSIYPRFTSLDVSSLPQFAAATEGHAILPGYSSWKACDLSADVGL
jgi:hypothetical protein